MGGDSPGRERDVLWWDTLGPYPGELLDGNKTPFWSLKDVCCFVLALYWFKRGEFLVFPLPPLCAALFFCVWTGILGLFFPYFNPSQSLLLGVH